jgi:hypothetical protein
MMLHKGDLVTIEKLVNSKQLSIKTGVVICDPYATVMSEYTGDGNALYTCEKIVVDVLCGTKLFEKVPIDMLVRCNK